MTKVYTILDKDGKDITECVTLEVPEDFKENRTAWHKRICLAMTDDLDESTGEEVLRSTLQQLMDMELKAAELTGLPDGATMTLDGSSVEYRSVYDNFKIKVTDGNADTDFDTVARNTAAIVRAIRGTILAHDKGCAEEIFACYPSDGQSSFNANVTNFSCIGTVLHWNHVIQRELSSQLELNNLRDTFMDSVSHPDPIVSKAFQAMYEALVYRGVTSVESIDILTQVRQRHSALVAELPKPTGTN